MGSRSKLQDLAAIVSIIGVIAGLYFGMRSCVSGKTEVDPPSPSAHSAAGIPAGSGGIETPLPSSPVPANTPSETQYLVDLDPLSSSFNVDRGSVDLHGKTFPQSISLRVDKSSIPANDAEYTLAGRWKTFDATIGVRDDSPTGGRLTFEVLADGRSVFVKELAKGSSQDLHLAVAGIQTLKLKVSFTGGDYYDNYSYGAWGDARLGNQ
ncbi:NPCBM/NEW2 domain-containing protein [Kitasatospora purpeofusca]|uniref:NPCBM/NEW2 domain-containing protein n=1 Tax=Kitasatospora purpeofusca TaxID=67352 RepID=UPI0035DB9384